MASMMRFPGILRRKAMERMKVLIPESQVCALEAAATILGRTWKSQLREMWMSGNYGVLDDYSADLQNFRNSANGGPAGLNKYKAIRN
jgi:hypothetical protein